MRQTQEDMFRLSRHDCVADPRRDERGETQSRATEGQDADDTLDTVTVAHACADACADQIAIAARSRYCGRHTDARLDEQRFYVLER